MPHSIEILSILNAVVSKLHLHGWKTQNFTLEEDSSSLSPKGSSVLTIQNQKGAPTLLAMAWHLSPTGWGITVHVLGRRGFCRGVDAAESTVTALDGIFSNDKVSV